MTSLIPKANSFSVAVFCLLSGASVLKAEVKLNGLFCDNAVLQQGREVPVWGTARDGEVVVVEIENQKVSATAQNGKWMVRLKNLKVGGPYTMTITGDNSVILHNLLVGEVWVCSGQSNMERQLGPRPPQQPLEKYQEEAAAANYPQIRHFEVPHKTADMPGSEVISKWDICDPQTALGFTAVGYFFGSELHKSLKVPIGLIHSSWGGTPAQAWTSSETIAQGFPQILEAETKAAEAYPELFKKFELEKPELLEKWKVAAEAAKAQGKPEPRKPAPPRDPRTGSGRPSVLFNAMIQPLLPYAIRGVIWYQGESDSGRAALYRSLFPAMISNWRQVWQQGEFPFLFVQIAPHGGMNPEIREVQFLTWKTTPNTAMAVITDAGDAKDIHPTRKRPVGERLALSARGLVYGEKLEYSGPAFESMVVDGEHAVLTFSHRGGGLVAKDGELRGFTVAGEDNKFVSAKAEIKGETIVVSSELVPKPVAVRYGWENVPDVNLFNQEGLPASPFRSDVPAGGAAK